MPTEPLNGFAAIRGHERVRRFLRAAAANDRLPHAMLFAGADGIGKRTLALALVAWLLCEANGDDACGACASCRQVAAGSHPDFQLLAVASGKKEIGVDRVRDVKRFTQLRPVRGSVKVAVIDDAHMLTVAAQNALLKTLEEPPERSLLILVANTPDALLPTVRSRCQRVQFSPLSNDTVTEILESSHNIAPAVARQLAALAEGSPGRALALSRCAAEQDGPPQLAGVKGARYVELMRLANQIGLPEADSGTKLELLLFQLRDAAVRGVGAAHLALGGTPEPTAAAERGVRASLQAADLIHAARESLRRSTPNRQLLLEAVLLRLARAE
jgi:DNA polymerase III subunit delta'